MVAWVLTVFYVCAAVPFWWAWREMRISTKRAKSIIDNASAIEARAALSLNKASELRIEARKLRDQWKIAMMCTPGKEP